MGIWDYWVFFWDRFPSAYHNVHTLGKDIRYYHSANAKYLRVESEACDTASFRSLKNWLGYRLMDDRMQDEKALIRKFLACFYGTARRARSATGTTSSTSVRPAPGWTRRSSNGRRISSAAPR